MLDIDYPTGEISPEGGVYSLTVDDAVVKAWERDGLIYLSCVLGKPDGEALAHLAGFAAGRILKEEATLAWDPSQGELFLWQAVSVQVGSALKRRFFEVFCTSCDWWKARFAEMADVGGVPEMMIRP